MKGACRKAAQKAKGNDGLVEILGAVSGFFAAFSSTAAVVTAGFTVGVTGALLMAAGAYIGAGSEAELREIEDGRRRFMGEAVVSEAPGSLLVDEARPPRRGVERGTGGHLRARQNRRKIDRRSDRREPGGELSCRKGGA